MSDGHELLNAFYVGMNIQNILYGIALLLYFKTMCILLRNRGARKKSNLFYALFNSMMLFLVTIWVATKAIFGQKLWLLDSGYPGGPYAYWNVAIGAWYMEWGRVVIIILQLMTDGLMIYRCRIIWISNRVVIAPIILWLAALTMGVLVEWCNTFKGVKFDTGICAEFTIAYWSIAVFLNTILTCMICYRVVRHGRRMQKRLGREYASPYYAIATVVIESVLPYTLCGIIFLVALGLRSPTFVAFNCVYVLTMCISPQMLILRVIAGKAWDNETFSPPNTTTFNFNHSDVTTPVSQSSDTSEARVQGQTQSDIYPLGGPSKVRMSEV